MERVRVGDVLRLERKPVDPDPLEEYTAIGVRSFGKGIFHYEPVPGAQLGKLRFFRLQPDCLVISNIKGWEGAIAVSGDLDAECLASSRFLTYVPIDERIDVRWARWFFLSDAGMPLIQQASPGSADRNRTLAIDRFEAIEIPLPSIEEQRQVAMRLRGLAAGVRRMEELAKKAYALSDALTVSATSRPDLDVQVKSASGWDKVELSDLLSISQDEVTVNPSASYDIAGVYSFGQGMFPRTQLHGAQTSYRRLRRLQAGQLVMSRLKAWEGALAIVPEGLSGFYVSPEFPTFDVDKSRVEPDFLGSVVKAEAFWGRLKGVSQGIGARRERVSTSKLLEQALWLPPVKEQRRLLQVVDFAEVAASRRREFGERLAALVPAALNQAFGHLN